jgi:tetratricopeptide (TPR) repeat protein
MSPQTGEPRRTRTGVRPVFEPAFLSHWSRVTPAEALLALTVIAAPLAIGGVHVETQAVLGVLALSAMLLSTARLHREGRRVRVGLLGLALLLALAWAFLQWVPLPTGLVASLSPSTAESRLTAASLARLPAPTWMPLTLDMGRSAEALLALTTLTATYLTTTSLRTDSNVRLRLTIYVELAALGVLFAGLLHLGLGLDRIWGFYRPVTTDFASVPFGTTFVNPNHAAALMLLGALVAFGASLAPDRAQRWHLATGIALSAGLLATLSRANAVLLLAGLLALTLPPLFSRRDHDLRAHCIRLLIGALACLSVALILIGPERWLAELASLGRPDLGAEGLVAQGWGVALDVVRAHPWLGVGAGAFQFAASSDMTQVDAGLLAFAHHAPLQILADLGVVVGGAVMLLALAGLAVLFRRTRRDLPTFAGLLALFALLTQNLVDFSLWIPGVSLGAFMVLGFVTTAGHANAAPRLAWRWPMLASAPVCGVFLVALLPALRDGPEHHKAQLREALAAFPPARGAPSPEPPVAEPTVAAPPVAEPTVAIDRGTLALNHANDFQTLLLVSALADRTGAHDEARAWAERALTLAPYSAHTLVTAARLRLTAGDHEGGLVLLERLDPGADGDMRAVELALTAPDGPTRERFFSGHPKRVVAAVLILDGQGRATTATDLLLWALKTAPRAVELHETLGLRRFNDRAFLAEEASLCLSEAGLIATDSPEGRAKRAAWERIGYLLQGRAEYLGNRDIPAWFLFLAAADADPAPRRAERPLLEAARTAERVGRMDWLDEALGRLDRLVPIDAWVRGEYHLFRSKQHEVAGDLASAIREMHEVLRHLGHVPGFHHRLADLFDRNNDGEAAARARERAIALEPKAAP